MKAPEFLQAALGHMQDRASTYDKPDGERSMGRTVGAFNAITSHALTEEQGWLFMGLLKMVRSQSGDFKADNFEDEAAYAALRGECAAATVNQHDADGWINWDGGECPVDDYVFFDVRFRCGDVAQGNSWPRWTHNGNGRDIIAYRIHKESK